jgi:serine/threonine-protein kinase
MVAPPDRTGSVLDGKWRLERKLGEGGMGAVYAAVHVRNAKRVAVKILHDASDNAEILTRFQREGYVSNVIDDPGVVAVYDDAVAPDGTAYLVMDLLEGESIEDRAQARGGKLPWQEVLTIAHPALAVIQKAHERGIIHRDLKPSNLFLTSERRIKVLDFGLAGMTAPHLKVTGPTTPMMGTLGFMPPEQIRGEWSRVGPASDIWAMGATLFALLTGLCVHENGPPEQFLKRALVDPAPPIRSVDPTVPAEVAEIVDRALAVDPEARFRDAQEMRDAIGRAYDRLASGPLEPLVPSDERTPILDVSAHRMAPTERSAPSPRGPARAMTPGERPRVRPEEEATTRTLRSGDPVPSHSTPKEVGLSTPPLTLPPSVRTSRRALVLAGAVLVVGGLGVGTVMLLRNRGERVDAAPSRPDRDPATSAAPSFEAERAGPRAPDVVPEPRAPASVAPDPRPASTSAPKAVAASSARPPSPPPASSALPKSSAAPEAPPTAAPVDLDRRH